MKNYLIILLLIAFTFAIEADKVLLIGDQFFAHSGPSGQNNLIQKYCKSRVFKNRSINLSTALQWENETPCSSSQCCCQDADGASSCSASSAFSSSIATGYTHIWLQLGLNDYVNDNCFTSPAQITSRITAVFTDFNAIVGTGIFTPKYLMTGYLIPKEAPTYSKCTASHFMILNNAMELACKNQQNCQWIPISTLAEGSSTSWSSKKYIFISPVDVSEWGYCTIMSQPRIQNFFECDHPAEAYDCSPDLETWEWVVIGVVIAIVVICFIFGVTYGIYLLVEEQDSDQQLVEINDWGPIEDDYSTIDFQMAYNIPLEDLIRKAFDYGQIISLKQYL